MYDLVIGGAIVADGRGHDRAGPTVAVEDGRITKIGTVAADAAEVASAVPSISPRHAASEQPSGGAPYGVHGLFVNGVRVFDGTDCVRLDKGAGQVLDRFLPATAAAPPGAAL